MYIRMAWTGDRRNGGNRHNPFVCQWCPVTKQLRPVDIEPHCSFLYTFRLGCVAEPRAHAGLGSYTALQIVFNSRTVHCRLFLIFHDLGDIFDSSYFLYRYDAGSARLPLLSCSTAS